MKKELTAERLREVLDYSVVSGVFTWRVKTCKKVVIGARAGSRTGRGYRQIRVDGELYLEHRLAYLYVEGFWPEAEVDHANGNGELNAWVNIRGATSAEQKQNTRRRKDNTSGFKGVGWFRPKGKWRARIRAGGREVRLGYFDQADAAGAAYLAAKAGLHPFNPTQRA